jgi:hypothetical protein
MKGPIFNFFKGKMANGLIKVFKALWPEFRTTKDQITTIIAAPDDVAFSIRWFVVIIEGHDCALCLYDDIILLCFRY